MPMRSRVREDLTMSTGNDQIWTPQPCGLWLPLMRYAGVAVHFFGDEQPLRAPVSSGQNEPSERLASSRGKVSTTNMKVSLLARFRLVSYGLC